MRYSLKELRARKGLSQLEMAEKLGVSVQTYNAWETDFGMVKVRNAVKIANLFGVKVDDIFFNIEPENNSEACQEEFKNQEMKLNEIKTRELVEELKTREGISHYWVEPHENKTVTVNGPALVLVVID